MNLIYGTCVIVLGMHRSGTSVAAGCLARMGVDFGTNLLEAKPDNPKGFYEHVDLLAIDESILRTLGSSYDDASELPDHWWREARFESHKQAIQDVVRRDFGTSRIFGFKDPRISVLLPLYIEALDGIGVRPRFVVTTRPAAEIAESLRVRNDFAYGKSLALARKHVDSIDRFTRGYDVVRLDMGDLIRDPRTAMERVREALWIPLAPYESARKDIETFVDPTLKHHSFDRDAFLERVVEEQRVTQVALDESRSTIAAQATRIDELAAASVHMHNEVLRLEGLVREAEGYLKDSRSAFHTMRESYEAQGIEKESRITDLVVEIDHMRHAIESMERSLTWRISRTLHRALTYVAPEGSRAGRLYHAAIRRMQSILNDGWGTVRSSSVAGAVKSDDSVGSSLPTYGDVDVLFVNHEETMTGAPRVLFEIAKRVADKLDVVVVSKARGGMHHEFVNAFRDRLLHPRELIQESDRFRVAEIVLASIRPKLVYVNSIVSYEYAFAAKRLGIPVTFHVHEIGAAFDRAVDAAYHDGFKDCADVFVAVSEATRDFLVERMGCDPERVVLRYEFVDGDSVRAKAKRRKRSDVETELGLAAHDRLVVAVGTFDRRKGADLFVKAAMRARKEGSSLRFAWIGRGPQPVDPVFDVFKEGQGAFMHIPETANPFPYVARASALALPSREDPFPLVMLEAMALGIPVVAFERGGGAKEALVHGAGELVADFSSTRLLETLERLTADPITVRTMGEAGKATQRRFDAGEALRGFEESLVAAVEARRATI